MSIFEFFTISLYRITKHIRIQSNYKTYKLQILKIRNEI